MTEVTLLTPEPLGGLFIKLRCAHENVVRLPGRNWNMSAHCFSHANQTHPGWCWRRTCYKPSSNVQVGSLQLAVSLEGKPCQVKKRRNDRQHPKVQKPFNIWATVRKVDQDS